MINLILNEFKIYLEDNFKDNFTGLVLFGSYAKNSQNKNSDVDLLITFKKLPKMRSERLDLILEILMQLETKYKIDINPIISQENELEESFLLIDIAEYAKIIIDKNKIITKLFQKIKNNYKQGFYQKLKRENYYVLKTIENG